jgi:hypothetical protein
MAETVKKGARITGADRAKLSDEPTETSADGASREVPNESAPVTEGASGEEPRTAG